MSSAVSLVKLEDDAVRKLLDLEKAAPGTINKIAVRLVVAFKGVLRDDFMSGQILGERTGTAKKNIFDNYVRKGTYHLPAPRLANIFEGGAVISPRKGKAIRFVTPSGDVVYARGRISVERRPFWSMGWNSFVAGSYAKRIVTEFIDKYWTRRFN